MKDTAQNQLSVALPGPGGTLFPLCKKEGRMWDWGGWQLLTLQMLTDWLHEKWAIFLPLCDHG